MSALLNSTHLLKVWVGVMEPNNRKLIHIISSQYIPGPLARTFPVQLNSEDDERTEALRLKSSAIVANKPEAGFDVTARLECHEQNPIVVKNIVHDQLVAWESVLYPDKDALKYYQSLAVCDVLKIAPMEAPV